MLHIEYKLIQGGMPAINTQMGSLAADGWKPILMTSASVSNEVIVSVILEHVPQKFGQ